MVEKEVVNVLLGQTINGVIGPIFSATWSSLKAQYHEGLKDTELKEKQIEVKQAIEQASKNYHQRYLDRHCNIQILNRMDKGVSLDKIYTAVKFLGDSDLKYFSLDNLEELYRKSGNRRFRVGSDKRHDGLTTAKNEQYLMVLGSPGVGKSTFLRKLGLEALENGLVHELVPVFIELKSFKSEKVSLHQAIVKELKVSGFPYAEDLIKSMLSDGKMLLLLDGLDEVPSGQVDDVVEQIRDFCDQYSQNYFVASCRIAAYKGGFNRFTNVTIAEFDNEQIEQFIQRWFRSELDLEAGTADEFWKLISQPENISAKELAQTPLLLAFLCLVYGRSQELPAVRSTLYGEALDIILKEWAGEKRIRQDPIYKGFHTDLEKELLSEIAYQSFEADQLFFSEQEITDHIAFFLSDTLDAPRHLDGTAVLEAIEVQQGILVERATDTYSFSHLTLQEYLTASYISSEWSIQELVSEHLTDERWREVFLLVSGLTGRRSHELWLAMEQQANTFINPLKLQDLLRWITELSDSSLPSNQLLTLRAWLLYSARVIDNAPTNIRAFPTVRDMPRAFAFAMMTSVINVDIDDTDNASDGVIASVMNVARASDGVIASVINVARAIAIASDSSRSKARASDFAIAIAIAIASSSDNTSNSDGVIDYGALSKKLEKLKKQIPSDEATRAKWQNFAEQLLETYLTFFHLDRELIDFSPSEAQALEKYLRATKFIIECKNAAVRVSRKEWEAIESRLLTGKGPENQEQGVTHDHLQT